MKHIDISRCVAFRVIGRMLFVLLAITCSSCLPQQDEEEIHAILSPSLTPQSVAKTQLSPSVSPSPIIVRTQAPTATHLTTRSPTLTSTPTLLPTSINHGKEYVGLWHPPLPDEVQEFHGASLAIINADGYSLSGVHVNQQNMLWLNRRLYYIDVEWGKKAFWEVRDTLYLPHLSGDEVLLLFSCSFQGKRDRQILAIGEYPYENRRIPVENVAIKQAWRINLTIDSLESISVEGVSCVADPLFFMGW